MRLKLPETNEAKIRSLSSWIKINIVIYLQTRSKRPGISSRLQEVYDIDTGRWLDLVNFLRKNDLTGAMVAFRDMDIDCRSLLNKLHTDNPELSEFAAEEFGFKWNWMHR